MPVPTDGTKGAFLQAWLQESAEKAECSNAVKDCAACIDAYGAVSN